MKKKEGKVEMSNQMKMECNKDRVISQNELTVQSYLKDIDQMVDEVRASDKDQKNLASILDALDKIKSSWGISKMGDKISLYRGYFNRINEDKPNKKERLFYIAESLIKLYIKE